MKLKHFFTVMVALCATFSFLPASAVQSGAQSTNAQQYDEIGNELAKALYQSFSSAEMRNDLLSDGTFDDVKVARDGKNIFLTFRFSPSLNLSIFSPEERDNLINLISQSFLESAGAENTEAMILTGVKLIITFTDHQGDSISREVP